MTLILKYKRKDFFGNSKYEEDKISHFAKNDLIKSFLFFYKNKDAVIKINNIVMFWHDSNDFKSKSVSVRFIEKENVSGGVIPFDMLKQSWYRKFHTQKNSIAIA